MLQLAIDNKERLATMVESRLTALILEREFPILLAKELIKKAKPIDHVRRNEKHIAKYKANLQKRFKQMEREVLAKIKKPSKDMYHATRHYWIVREFDVDQWLFSQEKWRGILADDGKLLTAKPLNEAGQVTLTDLDIDELFDQEDRLALEWLATNSKNAGWKITDTLYEKLRKQLMEAVAAGESIPKIRERVMEAFENISKVRAELISRTEVLKASNRGVWLAMKQSGVVEGKQWQATGDPRCCSQCMEMDGIQMPLDKPFFEQGDKHKWGDGTESLFDYEEIVHPPLHPDCRCTLLAIMKEV